MWTASAQEVTLQRGQREGIAEDERPLKRARLAQQPLELEVQALGRSGSSGAIAQLARLVGGTMVPAQGLAPCCAWVSSVWPTSSMRRISAGVNGRAPGFVDSPAASERLVQASAASPSWSSG